MFTPRPGMVTGKPVPAITTATFTLGHLSDANYDGPLRFPGETINDLYILKPDELNRLLRPTRSNVPTPKPLHRPVNHVGRWLDALGIGEDEISSTFLNGAAIMEQIAEWFLPVRVAEYHPTRYEIDCSVILALPHLPVEVPVFTGDMYEGAQVEGLWGRGRLAKKVAE